MSARPMRTEERTDLDCPYSDCDGQMELRESRYGPFYGCSNWQRNGTGCDATHGAHPNGAPLGVPATETTKAWRIRVHELLDPLWEYAPELPAYDLPIDPDERERAVAAIQGAARGRVYRLLSVVLELPIDETHVGHFDETTCRRAFAALSELYEMHDGEIIAAAAAVREWGKARARRRRRSGT